MANPYGPPEVDFSSLANLPSTFEKGAEIGRQRQLRDLMGSDQAQKMIQAGDYRGLAALAYRIDPQYGQKLLTQATAAKSQSQLFGTPVWGKEVQPDGTTKEVVGAFGRDGVFHKLDTGTFQPQRGVTMGNLGYAEGTFSKGEGLLTGVTPKTGPLPEGYIPPQGFMPFGAGGGTQQVMPTPQSGVGPLPPGMAPVQPQETPAAAQPQAQAAPPMPGATAPAAAPPQAVPATGGYMPGSEPARKAAMSIKGKTNIGLVAGLMAKNYEALIKVGGIRTVGAPSRQNIEAYVSSSAPGQAINRIRTTAEQSIRDRINNAQPGLLAQMRAATELSARSLDSNIELQFYMQQLGSTYGGEGLTNLAAIDAFSRAYGTDPDAVKNAISPELYKKVKDAADDLIASRPRTLDALAAISPEAAQRAADLTQAAAEQGRQAVPQTAPPQGKIAKGSAEEAAALKQARDAIMAGADQGAVLKRLEELGISQ